uniref:HMG box domain-containing protein n=1 Tax=Picocystis salinarum TaxID=88271 RepID=A0A7S3U9J4_9CHLO|mmetsp:Transcript_578/g.4054  ORF Transcript_578/g.4054 Transcript_578/m.4054 type:complete len:174 (+) Transcript_578:103-624(+)
MVVERFAKAVERSWKGWTASRGHVKHVLGSRNAAAASEDVAASEKKVEKRPPPTPKPYALFVKDRFQIVRRKHPLDNFQQTAARLGELWRKMGREEKERYAHLARVGWEKQAAAWFAAHPKRKPSPYANFVKVEMPRLKRSHPAASFADLSRMCGQQWHTLTPHQREPYAHQS